MTPRYHTQFECDECGATVNTTFEDPSEPFDATCDNCGAYYEGLYV